MPRPFSPVSNLSSRAMLLCILFLALGIAASIGLPAQGDVALQASCTGDNSTGGALTLDTPLVQTIPLSCAPTGATVTHVQVTVNLDHDCSADLEISIENGAHTQVLQTSNCQIGSGPMVLDFGEPTHFDGDPVNGDWKLTITDRCRPCNGYLALWSIRVDYEEPPRPTATPTVTARPSATATTKPTATATATTRLTATATATTKLTSTATPTTRLTATTTPRATPSPTATRWEGYVTFPGGPWPWYAQGEISVHPYPPGAGEPTEICVELLNPTAAMQTVAVQFSWANFGIGLAFTPIGGPRQVQLPPHSVVKECIHWVPPIGGHVCIQVELFAEGYQPQRSQRNMDVDEPLRPGQPHTRFFPVGNPTNRPVTVTLGIVPHVANWGVELSQDVLPNMAPGEVREVALTVTPPQGVPLPEDGTVIVDVEAYIDGQLIGGFRKVFRPPIAIHPVQDPPYAEREISVYPYPPRAGEPTELCVELRNPTAQTHEVAVQFSWANFGIGIPFTPIGGPRQVQLPPYSVVKLCIEWVPPVSGHVCILVELFAEGYQPQRSQRNIEVAEAPPCGETKTFTFTVYNDTNEPTMVDLGMTTFNVPPHWVVTLSPSGSVQIGPGQQLVVTVTVYIPCSSTSPTADQGLESASLHATWGNAPTVDVGAYIDGELVGGIELRFGGDVPMFGGLYLPLVRKR
jgi:subtilisin-like proprotein convertase family protein